MENSRPKTLAECFEWLEENLSPEEIMGLQQLSKEELWQTHQIVRRVNEELLQDNAGLEQMLDGSAFCDNPNMANQIVTAFWDHLQMKGPSR